ncbi:MAG: hypothetical protein J6K17_14585 [Oscillospiraceae bacterium]|nr:hypothetical protein [Oscillospiraceae bacterium]
MKMEDVKGTLGKRVHYSSKKMFIDSDYIFRAYILRISENGKKFQQAELKDLCENSVIIVPLEEVEVIETPQD